MAKKMTTRDLIGCLIDLELDRQMLALQPTPDDDTETNQEIMKIDIAITNIKNDIARKTSGIDHMIVEMNKNTNLIGNDGVFQTDTTRYKMFETWGPLEVTDEEAINDNYKRYKVEIDKKKARKEVIAAAEDGLGISGFKIEKVKRVRRS